MNKSVLVSVIVPVYGTEAYLPACIDSICNQTYSNIQIILVDDQSPDRCPEICDSYAQKDARIMVIHQQNKGVSGARNTGMNHAEGDYIMFVDSDDELYPEAVESLLRDAIEYNADIVSAAVKTIYPNGVAVYTNNDKTCLVYHNHEAVLLSLNGDQDTIFACAKLFAAILLQDVRFEEGKKVNEDGYFLFQCYMKQPVLVQHNVPVYQYNIREGSASRQKYSEKYLAMLYFCERKKALIAEQYPQYMEQAHNMEVRTNLYLLDVLCSTTEKKHRSLERQCAQTVRSLYRYHRPINDHQKMQAWIVAHGLYPLYKRAVRMKYYR